MSDALQNMLRSWAERETPTRNQLDTLCSQIRTRAVTERESSWRTEKPRMLSRMSYAALGALAALLVVAAIHWKVDAPSGQTDDSNGATQMALISPAGVKRGQRLFSEVERLFTDRLRWVAQSNGDVSLGVDALEGPVSADCLPAVVKLVVVARDGAQAEWHQVWQTEVILRSEESVEVVPRQDAVDKVALWVYPLADGRIAVDTDLALATPLKISSQYSAVLTPGVPAEIVDIEQDDVEYRVLQTVAMLDRMGGQ